MKKELQEMQDLCAKALTKAEAHNRGEILPFYLERSDYYPAAHYKASLIMAIVFYCLYCLCAINPWWEMAFTPQYVSLCLALGMLAGFVLAFKLPLKRFLTPGRVLKEEAHQKALEIYFQHDLNHQAQGLGVLLFISELERYVEIVAAPNLNKIEKSQWKNITSQMARRLRTGALRSQTLAFGIEEIGKLLDAHYPRDGVKTEEENLLPNSMGQERPGPSNA